MHTVGIVGTGFIGRGLASVLDRHFEFEVRKILTRRPLDSIVDHPTPSRLTNSVNELIDACDIIIECSGEVLYASEVVDHALASERIVLTMNAEFQVTTGSYWVGKGRITEAQGDQPGSLASFAEEVRSLGFVPLVYGNRKGYININPSIEQMQYWSKKQGISLPQVISFTDGTKIQCEQALVANGLGADIVRDGLLGLEAQDLNSGGQQLVRHAISLGTPISDYVVAPNAPAGIFIVASHDTYQQHYLEYLKLGPGPYYVLIRPFHLCHLEIGCTIRRMLEGKPILLDNCYRPRIGVAAVAKRQLGAGEQIHRGAGSFAVRGKAIRIAEHPDHLPIGLLENARVKRPIYSGDTLTMDDVDTCLTH